MLRGRGGLLKVRIGAGAQQIWGEVDRWSLQLNRENLKTTTLADEEETNVPGMKASSGVANYFIRMYQDPSRASALQMIPLILRSELQAAKVVARFYLQSPNNSAATCGVATSILDDVWLEGEIVLGLTGIESAADDLLLCRSQFEISGPLGFYVNGLLQTFDADPEAVPADLELTAAGLSAP